VLKEQCQGVLLVSGDGDNSIAYWRRRAPPPPPKTITHGWNLWRASRHRAPHFLASTRFALLLTMATSSSACVDLYLTALQERNQEAFTEAWHSDGLRLGLTPNGTVAKQDASLYVHSLPLRTPIKDGHLLSQTHISSTCTCAKIRLVESSKVVTEFVTMLKEGEVWKIISSVQSIATANAPVRKIIPSDFTDVSTAVWDGYVAAGRAYNSEEMGKVFHPECRLTFAADGAIMIISSNDFCKMVKDRWSMDSHIPFAHLKNDPRISSADTLISVDIVGTNVAMVTLKIGYPPFLYHDVLLLLRVSQPVSQRKGSSAGWWIVAKSSDHEPWMENEGTM